MDDVHLRGDLGFDGLDVIIFRTGVLHKTASGKESAGCRPLIQTKLLAKIVGGALPFATGRLAPRS